MQRATASGPAGLFILYIALIPVMVVAGALLRMLVIGLVLLLLGPKRRPVAELLGELMLHQRL